jgi:hypothetical protein
VAKRRGTEGKVTLDQLIAQTTPVLKSFKISPQLMDLDRLSRLEDLDRLWEKIRAVLASVKGVGYRVVTEEHFQWFVDLLDEKYHAEETKIEQEYPVPKRKR